MTNQIQPVGFDHIVLRVADVERSLEFYCGRLGLEPMKVEEWRAGKTRFPSARVSSETIIDLVAGGPEGVNLDHFCIVVAPVDFEALAADGAISIESGPAMRSGAQGSGTSVYVQDPDDNLVELRYY